jgi:hypothetical protein
MASLPEPSQSINQIDSSSNPFILYIKLLSGDIIQIDIDPHENQKTFTEKIFKYANPDRTDSSWKVELFLENGDKVNFFYKSLFKSGDMLFAMIREPTLQIIRTDDTLYDGRMELVFRKYMLAIQERFSIHFWYNPNSQVFAKNWIELFYDPRTGNREQTLLSSSLNYGLICQDAMEFFHKMVPEKFHLVIENQFAEVWQKIVTRV